jgi:hypothetical protein
LVTDGLALGHGVRLGGCGIAACPPGDSAVSPAPMTRFFDMDDHARLPWRFHHGLRRAAGA